MELEPWKFLERVTSRTEVACRYPEVRMKWLESLWRVCRSIVTVWLYEAMAETGVL